MLSVVLCELRAETDRPPAGLVPAVSSLETGWESVVIELLVESECVSTLKMSSLRG